ncbi:MAG: hypothetical protein AAF288_00425 [Planctomycetota bacterium]
MRFYPHWAQGERDGFRVWGWSDRSVDHARQVAMQRAANAVAEYNAPYDENRTERWDYYPIDRPLREAVIDSWQDASTGQVVGAISRNHYGSLVLNSSRVMFVDIDPPAPKKPKKAGGFLSRLFGGGPPEPAQDAGNMTGGNSGSTSEGADDPRLDGLRSAAVNAGLQVRVYRTPAGYRGLVMNRTFDPRHDTAHAVMNASGADKLYVSLCHSQDCFRARLTAKPWRIGLTRPPRSFPFANELAEARFEAWLSEYEPAASAYAACAYLDTFGPLDAAPDPEADRVMRTHDALACGDGMPLA